MHTVLSITCLHTVTWLNSSIWPIDGSEWICEWQWRDTPHSLKLLGWNPHHQWQFNVISYTLVEVGWGLSPLQRCSQYILQPQPIRLNADSIFLADNHYFSTHHTTNLISDYWIMTFILITVNATDKYVYIYIYICTHTYTHTISLNFCKMRDSMIESCQSW